MYLFVSKICIQVLNISRHSKYRNHLREALIKNTNIVKPAPIEMLKLKEFRRLEFTHKRFEEKISDGGRQLFCRALLKG